VLAAFACLVSPVLGRIETGQSVIIKILGVPAEEKVNQQIVHLAGYVKSSGPRPFTQGLTIFQAIQAAGGEDQFGAMNRVILYREGKQQEINLKKAERKSILAEPNDTIEVPLKGVFGG